jgi:hypothetical protein
MWLLKVISSLINFIIQNVFIFNLLRVPFSSVYISMRVVVTVMNLTCLILCPGSLVHHFCAINVNPEYAYWLPLLTAFFMPLSSPPPPLLNCQQDEPATQPTMATTTGWTLLPLLATRTQQTRVNQNNCWSLSLKYWETSTRIILVSSGLLSSGS